MALRSGWSVRTRVHSILQRLAALARASANLPAFWVTEFLHVKPGKGAAFVRTKLKHQITGAAAVPRRN